MSIFDQSICSFDKVYCIYDSIFMKHYKPPQTLHILLDISLPLCTDIETKRFIVAEKEDRTQ